MSQRLRTLLLIAGSVLVIGAAGTLPSAVAGATIFTEPPAAEKPGHGNDEDHDAGNNASHDAGHDEDVSEPAADHGAKTPPPGSHDAPKKAKPSKAVEIKPTETKPTEIGARKPLFGSKPKEQAEDPAKAQASSDEAPTADRALELLREGNQRWVSGDVKNPNIDQARRTNAADKGQKPFATILTCADSRIPVERIFDRGVAEIFTVRVAGNVAGASETGSIEYGVGHLHTPVLVVMGHTKCGAVAAAASGAELHGKVAELITAIAPAVQRVKRGAPDATGDALAAMVVKENVWQSIFDLYKSSDELRSQAREGKVRVVGAIYDISSGKVEWLGEHPWQSQILDALQVQTATAPHDSE